MRLIRIVLCLALMSLLLCGAAQADEARDISKDCTYTCKGKAFAAARMLDRDYMTHSNLGHKAAIEVTAPKPVSGVFVQLYKNAVQGTVQAKVNGEWQDVGSFGEYITQWVPLPIKATELRIVNSSRENMYIAELTVYGAGDRPARAAGWTTLDKADLMLLVAHPDDDLLWFGGFLPTYAGELGYKVQVVYLTVTNPNRML